MRTFAMLILLGSLILIQTSLAQSQQEVTPKSKGAALRYSLISTLAPAVVGGVLMLVGQNINPVGFDQASSNTNDEITIFGLVLGSTGLVFGPGVGHAYAGRPGHFWGGAAIRGIVFPVGFFSGLGIAVADIDRSLVAPGLIFVAAAGAVFLYSSVFDIVTTGRAVEKWNKSHPSVKITVHPHYFVSQQAVGVSLSLAL